jgi:hypothetical protein
LEWDASLGKRKYQYSYKTFCYKSLPGKNVPVYFRSYLCNTR